MKSVSPCSVPFTSRICPRLAVRTLMQKNIIYMFLMLNSPPSACSCWHRISRSQLRDNQRRARSCFPPGGSSSAFSKPPVQLNISPCSHPDRERERQLGMCFPCEAVTATEKVCTASHQITSYVQHRLVQPGPTWVPRLETEKYWGN